MYKIFFAVNSFATFGNSHVILQERAVRTLLAE